MSQQSRSGVLSDLTKNNNNKSFKNGNAVKHQE